MEAIMPAARDYPHPGKSVVIENKNTGEQYRWENPVKIPDGYKLLDLPRNSGDLLKDPRY
jgi:hypothetical protein